MDNGYLKKLIEDLAEKYAVDNQEFIGEEDWITNYYDLKTAFIDGFKAGMKFKEKENWQERADNYLSSTVEKEMKKHKGLSFD